MKKEIKSAHVLFILNYTLTLHSSLFHLPKYYIGTKFIPLEYFPLFNQFLKAFRQEIEREREKIEPNMLLFEDKSLYLHLKN